MRFVEVTVSRRSGRASFALSCFTVLLSVLLFGIIAGGHTTIVTGLLLWGGSIGVLTVAGGGKVQSQVALFSFSFAATVTMAVVLYIFYESQYGRPYFIGGSDDLSYELLARTFASEYRLWEVGGVIEVVGTGHNSPGYVYVVSVLVEWAESIGEFTTTVPRLLNACAVGWLAVLTTKIADWTQLSADLSKFGGFVVGLWPMILFVAGHTFRDVLVALLILAIVYGAGTVGRRHHGGLLVWGGIIGIALIGLVSMRPMAALAASVVGTVAWGLSEGNGRLIPSSGRGRIVLAFTLVVVGTVALAQLGVVETTWLRLEMAYEHYRRYRTELSSGLARRVFVSRPIVSFPLRIAYLAVYPPPELSLAPHRVLISVGTLVQVSCLPLLGRGLFEAVTKRGRALAVAAAFTVLFVGEALISFQPRHVVQFVPFGVILTMLGWSVLSPRLRRHYLSIGYLVTVLLLAAYLLAMM